MRRTWPALVSALALLPSVGHSQIPEEPGRRLLEQQRRTLEERRNQPTPEILQPAPEEERPGAAEGPCFQIDVIELDGATLLSEAEQGETLSQFRGRCLGQADLNALLEAITAAYVERGWVAARAYLPPQNVRGGRLKVTVVEGAIESLQLGENGWREQLAAFFAFPTSEGSPLRLQEVEQGLDQLNRLPSNRATAKFVPGDKPGGTKVVIENQPEERFRFTASTNNHGQQSTGKIQRGVGLEADNPLGINDQWIVNASSTRSSNAFAGTVSVPFGWWTLSANRAVSEYLQIIDGQTQLYGSSWIWSAMLDRVIYRDSGSKTSVYGRLGYNRATRTINDVDLTPQKLAPATVGVTHTWRTREGRQVVADAGFARGLRVLGATKDPEGLEHSSPHAQFTKLSGALSWVEPLSFATFRSAGQGIWGKEGLYSPEQIQIGDPYTVRGYSKDQAVGDRGLYLRNELIFDWPEALGGDWLRREWNLNLQPYLLADAGYVCARDAGNCPHVGGVGGGARFGNSRIALDASVARAVWASGSVFHDPYEFYLSLNLQVLKW